LLAAALGLPTVFLIRLATPGSTTTSLIVGAAQSAVMIVAVYGLREILAQLSQSLARAVFAIGIVGYGASLAWFLLLSNLGSEPASVVVAVVARVSIGLWILGSALAVGRGNGNGAALIGRYAGGGSILVVVAALSDLFGPSGATALVGLSQIVGVLEVIYLILLWRWVFAALQPEPRGA
jgi:hypothetical protein